MNLEKKKTKNNNEKLNLREIKKMLSFINYEKKDYIIGIIINIITILFAGLNSILLRPIIDSLTNKNSAKFFTFFTLLIITAIIHTVLNTIGILKVAVVTQKIIKKVRKDIFYKLQKMPIYFLDKMEDGDLLAIFVNDVENVCNAIDTAYPKIFTSFVTIFVAIIIFAYFSIELFLCISILSIIFFICLYILSIKTKKYFDEKQEKIGEITTNVEETFNNIKLIKVFNAEKIRENKFKNDVIELKKTFLKADFVRIFLDGIYKIYGILTTLIILLYGGYLVYSGRISVGTIGAVFSLMQLIVGPISIITDRLKVLLTANASIRRIELILNEKEEIDNGKIYVVEKDNINYWVDPSENILKEVQGKIEFRDVYFEYNENEEILKGISFVVEKGEILAIVGKTGAGKTSIINLIPRLYEIKKGEILFDDINIKDISNVALRSVVGCVFQDTKLFSGTVKTNIQKGKIGSNFDEVESLIKKLRLQDFINNLKDGLETKIEEEVTSLSSGERQIISILRAGISKPNIILLDEATSKIDTLTEKNIINGIEDIMKNKTAIIIAHRLSTIRNADKILLIDDGKIVESGTFEELMKKKGKYFELEKINELN